MTYITKPNLVWAPTARCWRLPITVPICQETVSTLALKMEGQNLQSKQWLGREVARILTWWGGEPSWRMPTHSSWWSTQHCPQKFVISRYSRNPANCHSNVSFQADVTAAALSLDSGHILSCVPTGWGKTLPMLLTALLLPPGDTITNF